jgi:hypothetical protein
MKTYKHNSGLETHLGSGLKTTKRCPPKLYVVKRTSDPYKHEGEVRQKLTTSKDVMPVIAGYTSIPLVTKNSLHEVSGLFMILCMCKGTA